MSKLIETLDEIADKMRGDGTPRYQVYAIEGARDTIAQYERAHETKRAADQDVDIAHREGA